MSQHPYVPRSLEGDRALQRSSHRDHEPGLETIQWGRLLGGSVLAAYGLLRRRGLGRLLLAGAGAAIAYRGISNNHLVGGSLKRMALHTGATSPIELATSMTIERPVGDIYEFWRDFENLPRVLRHIESIDSIDHNRSRWVARLPGDIHLEWTARTLEDRVNELIAWKSVEGSDLYNEGYITFRPVFDGEATELHVRILYRPPAGQLGHQVAHFFEGLQNQLIREDLRSFKQLLETGEMATIIGQPSAAGREEPGRIRRLLR